MVLFPAIFKVLIYIHVYMHFNLLTYYTHAFTQHNNAYSILNTLQQYKTGANKTASKTN